jgi:hypothetical protein
MKSQCSACALREDASPRKYLQAAILIVCGILLRCKLLLRLDG